jgi:hypothetical protein
MSFTLLHVVDTLGSKLNNILTLESSFSVTIRYFLWVAVKHNTWRSTVDSFIELVEPSPDIIFLLVRR